MLLLRYKICYVIRIVCAVKLLRSAKGNSQSVYLGLLLIQKRSVSSRWSIHVEFTQSYTEMGGRETL